MVRQPRRDEEGDPDRQQLPLAPERSYEEVHPCNIPEIGIAISVPTSSDACFWHGHCTCFIGKNKVLSKKSGSLKGQTKRWIRLMRTCGRGPRRLLVKKKTCPALSGAYPALAKVSNPPIMHPRGSSAAPALTAAMSLCGKMKRTAKTAKSREGPTPFQRPLFNVKSAVVWNKPNIREAPRAKKQSSGHATLTSSSGPAARSSGTYAGHGHAKAHPPREAKSAGGCQVVRATNVVLDSPKKCFTCN